MKLTEYNISELQARVIVVVIVETFELCTFFGKKHQYSNISFTILDLRQFMRDTRQFTHDPRHAPIRLSQMAQRLNYFNTFNLILNGLS